MQTSVITDSAALHTVTLTYTPHSLSCQKENTTSVLPADSTDIFNKNIHTINRTASQGETVVFYCIENEDKAADVGWRQEGSLLFI